MNLIDEILTKQGIDSITKVDILKDKIEFYNNHYDSLDIKVKSKARSCLINEIKQLSSIEVKLELRNLLK
jgi:hypothetical protein